MSVWLCLHVLIPLPQDPFLCRGPGRTLRVRVFSPVQNYMVGATNNAQPVKALSAALYEGA